ncbi:M23 family metallopeptidase [Sulfitobacter sp. F26204]|uniref:M23 family metallopeptidase n=1 Tax=Sulfitobacter sp. F26204 TaxID=2996014 RepID=UPI00225E2CA4|nr:M23 family metallopeptidase [Sulfitobacter sp. F26204]MCX7561639.1 M23 family metallopeptidase [Sulfitobacter sp. F26204]
MPFEVDPAFGTTARHARGRRRRRLGLRVAVISLAICGISTCIFWGVTHWHNLDSTQPSHQVDVPENDQGDDGFSLVQSQETAQASIEVERLNSFIDLRRDPMILRFAANTKDLTQSLPAPPDFARGRLKQSGTEAILALKDRLFVAEKRLVTTLPSSRDDFALFKAQRSQGLRAMAAKPQTAAAAQGHLVEVNEAGSWGELIEVQSAEKATSQAAVYVETEIENTTSMVITLRENQRKPLYEDEIILLRAERQLTEILTTAGLSARESESIQRAASQKTTLPASLPEGSVVALRLRPDAATGRLMLMSVYSPQGYLTSLAQVGAGRFEAAADPWIDEDLLSRSDKMRQDTARPGELRLLDALYSAAIRNGIATNVVGELIVLMSQKYDLDRFVAPGDEMILLRAADPGPLGRGLGEIFYIGIHGKSGNMPCYVLAAAGTDNFACFDFDTPPAGHGGSSGLGGGFLVPVNGVKTSGFGPRHHPILKQLRNHNGVDWAAPTGTPVLAVAAGRIARAGDGGGYGNVIYIDHGNGVETRYAHLNAFAKGLKPGQQVGSGEVIGYVGTTGRSTGPHLHFELHAGGQPLDPLTYAGGRSGSASQAVDALVNQIIRVESAGVATAKNPLSTATGLGQFIQGTWLRMMRDYRPDLVGKMGRTQLLALRTDPVLSREMVRNLARENETYLRARGHQITAGRLYLAHFLGPAGAHSALRADPGASVLAVMGAQVVNANPFLRSKTISDLHLWADRKMARASGTARPVAPAPRPVVIPAEIKSYLKTVDTLLAML